MSESRTTAVRPLRLGLIGVFVAVSSSCSVSSGAPNTAVVPVAPPAAPVVPPATPAISPLSADDVSWLFPMPTKGADFANLISMQDLISVDPQDPSKRVAAWPDSTFRQFLAIAASPAAQVAGTHDRIGLPAEASSMANWFIAGVRFDAGAPGLSPDVMAQFGQSPQIRLIVQLITRNPDGTPNVHDTAGHLIFSFVTGAVPPAQPGCFPRPIPDLTAFKSIVSELAELRSKLGNGQLGANKVSTAGVPLGIHPGLSDPTTAAGVRQEMKALLERHLSGQELNAMATMGLPSGAPEPWIFLSMLNVPPGAVAALPNGGFVPVHGPTLDGKQFAMKMNPAGATPRVVPAPSTNNLAPATCQSAAAPLAAPPIAARKGAATADVFNNPSLAPDKTKDTLDLIADPNRSHFFNTDCVSCHTETQLTIERLHATNFPGIDPAVAPNDSWNVRNFGWGPPSAAHATVTRRTASETAAVVSFINSQMLGK